MIITAEISYYPLTENYTTPINTFISKLSQNNISFEIGVMSTIVNGEYEIVMNVLTESIKELMNLYPSVFNLKISNTCPI